MFRSALARCDVAWIPSLSSLWVWWQVLAGPFWECGFQKWAHPHLCDTFRCDQQLFCLARIDLVESEVYGFPCWWSQSRRLASIRSSRCFAGDIALSVFRCFDLLGKVDWVSEFQSLSPRRSLQVAECVIPAFNLLSWDPHSGVWSRGIARPPYEALEPILGREWLVQSLHSAEGTPRPQHFHCQDGDSSPLLVERPEWHCEGDQRCSFRREPSLDQACRALTGLYLVFISSSVAHCLLPLALCLSEN